MLDLRDGKGDRSGFCELETKILNLEGWYVGCEPILNLKETDYMSTEELNLCLTQSEKDFRGSIQEKLILYLAKHNIKTQFNSPSFLDAT